MAVAVVPREDNAFANDNPPPARNAVLARYRQASATWAGCATVLYSPWLNQICEAGRRANSAS